VSGRIVVPGAQPPKNSTLPPRPTGSTACFQTSGRPVASTVTSAPRPPVASRMASTMLPALASSHRA
jgi:hypothetical protein